MLRTSLIIVMLGLPGLALAQEITAEQRAACKGDYAKYCSSVTPGGCRILACLTKESAKLTEACKKALTAAERK